MSNSIDRKYYERRYEQEISRAAAAKLPVVAEVHRKLAAGYLDQLTELAPAIETAVGSG